MLKIKTPPKIKVNKLVTTGAPIAVGVIAVMKAAVANVISKDFNAKNNPSGIIKFSVSI